MKNIDEDTFTFSVMPSYTIREIREIIEDNYGILASEYALRFGGEVLENDRTVGGYKISDKSVINVIPRSGESNKCNFI